MNDTKEHILKTALILFLQKSYRDVTMNEIVEKTGLSKGAFYHYFDSKETLFKEIVFSFISMGEVDYSKFSKTSLKSFFNQYADYISNSLLSMNRLVQSNNEKSFSFNFFLILFEAASRFPDFLQIENSIYQKDLIAWKNIIATAKDNKEISSKSNDEEIAKLFLFCTDGVFLRFVNSDNTMNYKELLLETFNTIYKNMKV